jgi:hypothetical protein
MPNDKTVTMSRELAQFALNAVEYLALRADDIGYSNEPVAAALRAILAAPVVERQPEPEAFMYQHEETGLIGFVDIQQIEWGFEKNNPRLKIICPLYRTPPAPVAVLNERYEFEKGYAPEALERDSDEYVRMAVQMAWEGWHRRACLDKVKEMNR